MSYGDFTLKEATRRFGLSVVPTPDLFADVPESEEGDYLTGTLNRNYPLALANNTEKARSEFLVAPILVEVRERLGRRVALFSGIELAADASQGLSGVCDFLLARSPEQMFLVSPVLVVIEAKRDNIQLGLGQCAAAMVGARVFNERDGSPADLIYGAVTTGSLWQFLRLDGATLALDEHEYHIERIGKILGILIHCAGDAPEAVGAGPVGDKGRTS